MDIFAFALKMELDGEKYYQDLAEKVSFAELKTVLAGLAEDERRHYQIIQSVQQQTLNRVAVNPVLSKTRNVFTVAKEAALDNKGLLIAQLKGEQIDAYRAALVKETESVALYSQLKDSAEKQEEKIICEQLMLEEEKHVEVIENIIDMLNHVHDWVDAPEFNHRDVY